MRKPQQDPLSIDKLISQAGAVKARLTYTELQRQIEARCRRMYKPYRPS